MNQDSAHKLIVAIEDSCMSAPHQIGNIVTLLILVYSDLIGLR